MKAKFIYLTIAGLMIVSFLMFWRSTAQMQSSRIDSQKSNDKTLVRDSRSAKFDELIEKASQNGSVRVIVGLRADVRAADGELSSPARKRQRTVIKRAQNDLLADLAGYRVAGVKRFDFIPFLAVEADAAALEKIKNSPLVVSIQPDRLVQPSLTESTAVVGAPGGMANGFSGSGQAIAILDTGVDKNHSYFAGGKVVSEACYSTTTGTNPDFDSSQSLCPGGVSESTAPDSGLHCDTAQIGICWHGTHVAGIAAGRDPTLGHYGVAKDASIIAIQVFSRFNNPSNCGGGAPCVSAYTSDIIKGLERVYNLRSTFNIASVNMSFGEGNFANHCDGEEPALTAAVNNLRSAGIASVVASGNNGFTSAINFPACISTAVSVGSSNDGGNTTNQDTVNNFSNSGNILNLYAPGFLITSAAPNNQLRSEGGTSMAAPHVAGAWAILKQQNNAAPVSQVLTALTSTGRIITDHRPATGNRRTPRIRVDSASHQLAGTNCVRTPIASNQFIDAFLDVADCAAEAGVNRDLYSFSGTAGGSAAILMSSSEFDTFLYLLDPNGRIIAFDDNSGGGTNARIPASGNFILPLTGSYTILATKSGSFFAPGAAPQNGNYQIVMLAPTAAGVSVGGRVLSPNGAGVANARVTVTSQSGEKRAAITNSFGYFRFESIAAGAGYVFEISHKRYSFAPRVVDVAEELNELNFTAEQ
ncbi:MAG TPA: S8 family serine peptidase [Pyrinomonadaceae bacterium]|nr:S8 family serine peptidase [Pyrinomonadaceae bacterium]